MAEPIIDIDVVRDSTMQAMAGAVMQIAANTGGYTPDSYKNVRHIVRAGLADQFFHVGDQIIVEKETSIAATIGNTDPDATPGIASAVVNADAFIAAVGTVHNGDYEFIYDGAEWHYNGGNIQLAEFGITVTGTAKHGDAIVIHETAAKLAFDVIGKNAETPLDPDAKYSLTLQLHDCYASMQYDAREAIFAFPDGLTAGAYKFTIGAQPWYADDVNKVITFTLTKPIPAGGQLVVNNGYNATMAGATISSYTDSASTTAIETVTMSAGTAGTDLGTVNAAVNDNTNSIHRALLGSNNWEESALRQWLNSDKPAGEVWKPQTKFDRPPSWATSTAGFLHGLDPEFVSVLGKVKKTTALNNVTDGGGKVESTERIFLLSRSEVYAGNEVTGGEGAPYPYYANYSDFAAASTGADTNRIKYRNGAAQYWWLRSPYVGHASRVCYVSPSGTLSTSYAMDSNGVAPACVII